MRFKVGDEVICILPKASGMKLGDVLVVSATANSQVKVWLPASRAMRETQWLNEYRFVFNNAKGKALAMRRIMEDG